MSNDETQKAQLVTNEIEATNAPARKKTGAFAKAFLGGFLGALCALVLAAAAILSLAPAIKTVILSDELSRLAVLEQQQEALVAHQNDAAPRSAQLAQLTAHLQALESRPSESGAEIAALSRRLDELTADSQRTRSDVAAVQRSLPQEGMLLNLADRAERAERAVKDMTAQRQSAEAMLLAVGQLKDAVDRGNPFTGELRAARRFASPDTSALFETLGSSAAKGVPPRNDLIQALPALAQRIVQAEAPAVDENLWAKLLRQASSLISIRRVDGIGADAEAIVARAEVAAKGGDLARAADQLDGLKGNPAEVARPWVESARARIAADRTLSELIAAAAADSAIPAGR